ncbi:MAG TPA: vitamin K epoxide reductase family protein [Thermoplasmata archaeon]|nr:vitamin K epoxide reductase family protein [Thermoplasmata archaeon]
MKTRSWRSFVYLTGGFGLIASIYAGLESVDAGLRGSCTISSFFSCSAVDVSGKTSTLGIPDAAIGIAGFILILLVAALAERNSRDLRYLYALLFFTTGGVGFASYFAYVELGEIHALCPVCTAAYFFGVLVWAGAIGLTLKVRRRLLRKAGATPSGDAA